MLRLINWLMVLSGQHLVGVSYEDMLKISAAWQAFERGLSELDTSKDIDLHEEVAPILEETHLPLMDVFLGGLFQVTANGVSEDRKSRARVIATMQRRQILKTLKDLR